MRARSRKRTTNIILTHTGTHNNSRNRFRFFAPYAAAACLLILLCWQALGRPAPAAAPPLLLPPAGSPPAPPAPPRSCTTQPPPAWRLAGAAATGAGAPASSSCCCTRCWLPTRRVIDEGLQMIGRSLARRKEELLDAYSSADEPTLFCLAPSGRPADTSQPQQRQAEERSSGRRNAAGEQLRGRQRRSSQPAAGRHPAPPTDDPPARPAAGANAGRGAALRKRRSSAGHGSTRKESHEVTHSYKNESGSERISFDRHPQPLARPPATRPRARHS